MINVKPAEAEKVVDLPVSVSDFRRLGSKRVNNTLNNIRLIGNLAKYEHTAEEAERVFAVLRSALDECEGLFKKQKFAPKFEF